MPQAAPAERASSTTDGQSLPGKWPPGSRRTGCHPQWRTTVISNHGRKICQARHFHPRNQSIAVATGVLNPAACGTIVRGNC